MKGSASLRSIEILEADCSVRPGDCAQSIGENLRIVEFVRTALGYEAGGYWELKKILKLDVAGAVEETGRGVIEGAHSPQAERKQHGLRANTARD